MAFMLNASASLWGGRQPKVVVCFRQVCRQTQADRICLMITEFCCSPGIAQTLAIWQLEPKCRQAKILKHKTRESINTIPTYSLPRFGYLGLIENRA